VRYWGVDGANTGAAVLLAEDGVTALEWTEWKKCPRVVLPVLEGDILALEAPYLGKSARSFRVLCEWRERFKATLPPGVVLAEPNASHWRAKVLRVAGLARVPAKERAIRAATLHSNLPQPIGADLAEAWCLARWVWGWDRAARPGAIQDTVSSTPAVAPAEHNELGRKARTPGEAGQRLPGPRRVVGK
jgi:hypothetical protein